MGIGDGSSNGSQQSARKEIRDETTPLLPVKVEEDDGFHEFNGASFSGAVFNLSTTIVGAGIMALPASIKMLGIIPGILMIIIGAAHRGIHRHACQVQPPGQDYIIWVADG